MKIRTINYFKTPQETPNTCLYSCSPNPTSQDRYSTRPVSRFPCRGDIQRKPSVLFHRLLFSVPQSCCSFKPRTSLEKRDERDEREREREKREREMGQKRSTAARISTPTHNDILIKPRRWPSRGEIQSRDNKWSWPNTLLTADEPTPRLKQFTPFPCALSGMVSEDTPLYYFFDKFDRTRPYHLS